MDTEPQEPVFEAPWEAQAFAITVALHERDAFTWPEWTSALAAEVDGNDAAGYYEQWLAALERLSVTRGLCDTEDLDRYRTAWRNAATRTPHGTPISLAEG